MLQVTFIQNTERRFVGAAQQVILPAEDGELSIWDFHAPMLCALTAGDVQIDETRYAVRNGIACVERNRVTILTS